MLRRRGLGRGRRPKMGLGSLAFGIATIRGQLRLLPQNRQHFTEGVIREGIPGRNG